MIAPRAVAALAADVPLRDRLGLDVVVHRMTAVAQRAGRPLHIVRRIKLSPPVGIILDEVAAKKLVRDVPRHRLRIVVVTDLRKIALLPYAAIDQGDVFLFERHQRIRLGEIGQDSLGMFLGIAHDIRHRRLLPARVYFRVADAALNGAYIGGRSRSEQAESERKSTPSEDFWHVPLPSIAILIR